MKKIYSLLLTLAAGGILSATAQQLPSYGFEEEWVDCIPWNSKHLTKKQGTQPSGWCISNVTSSSNAACQTIGSSVSGFNSNKAIKVENKKILSQIIPGYFTLGTTWSTAKASGLGTVASGTADGGTWGGLSNFSYRPDALTFDYTRTNGSGSTEPATVIIYSWKGETQQANVPAENTYSFTNPANPAVEAIMYNRDRCVMDEIISGNLGGEVTKSSDFELISKTIYKITSATSSWIAKIVDIDYLNSSTPTMFNVIFASGNYLADRSTLKGDDALTVDNVKLIYYSRLASISVNGTSVAGFNSNTYNYTVDSEMPDESAFAFTCLGNSGSGKATLSLDKENAIATITVTNSNAGGTDVDGQTNHVYTLQFNKPAQVQPQLLTLAINGTSVNGFDPATYHYVIDDDIPEANAFAYTLPDGCEAKIVLDRINGLATITVSVTDSGSETSATPAVYTLQFNKPNTGSDVIIGDDFYGIYAGIVTVKAIEAGLGDADINRHGNVHIIDNGKNDGTCNFKLPNFALDDTPEGYIGDIVVENMTVGTTSDGRYIVAGTVNPLKLTMGGAEIVAKVTVSGSIDTAGKAVMDIDVIWIMDPENDPEGNEGISIPVKFNGTKTVEKPVYGGNVYKGTVTVDAITAGLGSENIVRNGEVHIIDDANDPSKCTFVLPDFALDDTADGYIGDIVVPGLTVAQNGLTKVYNGTVNPLKLTMAGSEIVAKVTVTGTIDADGNAVMDIDVVWIMDPENDPEGNNGVSIPVKFNGQFDAIAGIIDVPVDNSNAPVEYYNINGMRVNGDNLTPGIYIRRQGIDVQKILIK